MEPFNSGFGLEIADGEVEGLRESTDCRLQAAGSEGFSVSDFGFGIWD